jgi:hypothetical protein
MTLPNFIWVGAPLSPSFGEGWVRETQDARHVTDKRYPDTVACRGQSQWTARKREQMGIVPQIKRRDD